jgi:hypothetical protein
MARKTVEQRRKIRALENSLDNHKIAKEQAMAKIAKVREDLRQAKA